jgi:arylsulfatase A-like enzyme
MNIKKANSILTVGFSCLYLSTGTLTNLYANEPKPNILFAISDDQSFPHTSAYGCDWVKTPGFDYVAKQGLLFMNCYTPNAKCAPSRSSIITGRNSWQLEEAGNHVSIFPEKFKSFCEVLDEKTEYSVAFTGKGVAPVDAQGRNLTGKSYGNIKTTPPGEAISTTDYAANFEMFLNEKPDEKPFFFWYGGHEPHRAYDYRIGIEKGGKLPGEIDKVPDFWPDNEIVRTDMLDYAFEIEWFDQHLMKMIKLLEERGELDNTIIIVTADNGMPFPRVKGNEYEYSNHLPLAIMWPNGIKNPGRTIKDYISFIDFAPTIFELAGVKDPEKLGMQPIQGESILPIMESENEGLVMPHRDYIILGQERHDVGRPGDASYPIRSIIRDSFLYVNNLKPDLWPVCNPETGYLNTDGSPTKTYILEMNRYEKNPLYWQLNFGLRPQEELYDLSRDPECILNLAIYPEYADRIKDMKDQLFSELKEQGDPRMFGQGDVFDNYPYAEPNKRNFYEKFMKGEIEKSSTGWVNESDYEDEKVY